MSVPEESSSSSENEEYSNQILKYIDDQKYNMEVKVEEEVEIKLNQLKLIASSTISKIELE